MGRESLDASVAAGAMQNVGGEIWTDLATEPALEQLRCEALKGLLRTDRPDLEARPVQHGSHGYGSLLHNYQPAVSAKYEGRIPAGRTLLPPRRGTAIAL